MQVIFVHCGTGFVRPVAVEQQPETQRVPKYRDNMADSKSIAAVIVAAGRGERAGSPEDGPKQYRPIGGQAVLARTLREFLSHPAVNAVRVVIHPDDHEFYQTAIADLKVTKPLDAVDGGSTRQQSVLHGLEALRQEAPDIVLIHDGVRPFVDAALIDAVLEPLIRGTAAALPVVPLIDTIKRATANETVGETVPRANLRAAQTPQGFAFDQILDAHRRAAMETDHAFTDDSSIAEWAGIDVTLIAGNTSNVKLTVARDIEMADRELGHALPDVRSGNGYDVHALVAGDFVILCGVRIDHDRALSGHSDADVGLHALTDALLATCGAGDIGDHFPPTDPQWKGAESRIFLSHAAEIVREAGGSILNVDVTLICEAPKIGPHRQAMRRKLAELLHLDLERCSVKATTNETIGFVGRREGIAAIATASVIYGGRQ